MWDRDVLASRWPQFDLRISVAGAKLEVPTDSQMAELAGRASSPNSVLDETESHFVTWLRDRTSDEIEHHHITRVHSNRDLTRRPGWSLDLAVITDGEPVGIQTLSGFDHWPRRRIVGTSSWLLATARGRGLGTRCRAAVLELAFVHLRAEYARSWVLQDNRASIGVSAALGYHLIKSQSIIEHGRHLTELVYELSADSWLRSDVRRTHAPTVTGVQGMVALLDR